MPRKKIKVWLREVVAYQCNNSCLSRINPGFVVYLNWAQEFKSSVYSLTYLCCCSVSSQYAGQHDLL
jgi:hypothetical protein